MWPINQMTSWGLGKLRSPIDYYRYMTQGLNKIATLEQRLKNTSVDYAYLAELEAENKNLQTLLSQTPADIKAVGVAASIIKSDQAMVNKGSLDGIGEGQIVVDPSGVLVGRVRLVRPHVSLVERPVDSSARIAVKISRKPTAGILVGKGDKVILDGALQAESLEVGDVVVTSGSDGMYPPGLVVGTVAQIMHQPAEVTKQALVEILASTGSAVLVRD